MDDDVNIVIHVDNGVYSYEVYSIKINTKKVCGIIYIEEAKMEEETLKSIDRKLVCQSGV